MSKKKATKKRKPGPVTGSKRTNRNERLSDRLIDGTLAGLRAKAGKLDLYEYLATLAGVQNNKQRNLLTGGKIQFITPAQRNPPPP